MTDNNELPVQKTDNTPRLTDPETMLIELHFCTGTAYGIEVRRQEAHDSLPSFVEQVRNTGIPEEGVSPMLAHYLGMGLIQFDASRLQTMAMMTYALLSRQRPDEIKDKITYVMVGRVNDTLAIVAASTFEEFIQAKDDLIAGKLTDVQLSAALNRGAPPTYH